MDKLSKTSKDQGVETLRGLAILLMVAGHVIGGSEARGLNVPDNSWWRYYYVAFADIRMPLFTLLSGYVYALRPITAPQGLRRLLVGKSKRLLLPLLTVGSLFFILQLVVPATNVKPDASDYWKVIVYGIEHLWFIQAIFLIFLAVGILDALRILTNYNTWISITLGSATLYVFTSITPSWDIFSFSGAIRLLPFFLLGIGLHRYNSKLINTRTLVAWLGIFILALALRSFTIATSTYGDDIANRTLTMALGSSSVLLLFAFRRSISNKALSRIGAYSFGIYLLHTFPNAGTRLLLERIGVEDTFILFVVCFAAALAFPVIFEKTFGSWGPTSWMFLGQKPRRVSELTPAPRIVLRESGQQS